MAQTMAIGGFACGVMAGAIARGIRFCTFGAIEDYLLDAGSLRLKSWGAAIIVAMVCVQTMIMLGVARIDTSFYLSPDFGWLGAIMGGLTFGFGMSLVGTCSYGILVRLGGGDLKALIAFIIMGMAAYMTASGVTALVRVEFIEIYNLDLEAFGGQGMVNILSAVTGLSLPIMTTLVVALFVVLVFSWCFRQPNLWQAPQRFVCRGGHWVDSGGWICLDRDYWQ